MANICTTTYKVTGPRKAVEDLWNTLQAMKVNEKNVWLGDLAEHYGIDCRSKGISTRGEIYHSDFEAEGDYCLLTIETETAWTACTDLFDAVNEVLGGELSISWREIECGCGIFSVHDEGEYFPEQCCVSASGEPFDDLCEETFDTVKHAITLWCELTGIEQGKRDEAEMVELINDYEYGDEDTYFYINPFEFE